MSGFADRRYPEADEYQSDLVWHSAPSASCYEQGYETGCCVLSPSQQFCSAVDDEDAGNFSWLGRSEAFGQNDFARSDTFDAACVYYDQRCTSSSPATRLHPLDQPSNFAPLGRPTCFPAVHCNYVDLQPFRGGPADPWPRSTGDGYAGKGHHIRDQCGGLSDCPAPSGGGYSPAALEVPYSPSGWRARVKSERQSSSSTASSSFEVPPSAAKPVPDSASSCDDRKRDRDVVSVSGLVGSGFDGGFTRSADVDKDDWPAARCLSDTFSPLVDQLSHAVCCRRCVLSSSSSSDFFVKSCQAQPCIRSCITQ